MKGNIIVHVKKNVEETLWSKL